MKRIWVLLGVLLTILFCFGMVLYVRSNWTIKSSQKWITGLITKTTLTTEPAQWLDRLFQQEVSLTLSEELVPRPSRFLYLMQTESCLPSQLHSIEAIGNASSCQCDVLVLSFKQVCTDTPLTHVEYLFNSSSTSWGMGRNVLFEVAKRRNEQYLYYIFMDDDIVLETKTKKNPWRIFEEFLKRIEPAIGAVDIGDHLWLRRAYKGRENKGCSLKEPSDYLPVPRFDAAFNAFHYQAVDYILPYSCRFDVTSWWFAALYVNIKCEVIFAGQSVLHTELGAINPQHLPYPRKMADSSEWTAIVDEVVADLPEKYQNARLLSDWRRDGYKHEHISSTLCLPPLPPQTPIKPFAYLEAAKER